VKEVFVHLHSDDTTASHQEAASIEVLPKKRLDSEGGKSSSRDSNGLAAINTSCESRDSGDNIDESETGCGEISWQRPAGTVGKLSFSAARERLGSVKDTVSIETISHNDVSSPFYLARKVLASVA